MQVGCRDGIKILEKSQKIGGRQNIARNKNHMIFKRYSFCRRTIKISEKLQKITKRQNISKCLKKQEI